MSRDSHNGLVDKEMWFLRIFSIFARLGRLLANKRNITGHLSRKLITFHQLPLQRRTVINRAPTGMADCDKSCHNAENSLYPNIAGKRHEGDGLKAQKQLAQGKRPG